MSYRSGGGAGNDVPKRLLTKESVLDAIRYTDNLDFLVPIMLPAGTKPSYLLHPTERARLQAAAAAPMSQQALALQSTFNYHSGASGSAAAAPMASSSSSASGGAGSGRARKGGAAAASSSSSSSSSSAAYNAAVDSALAASGFAPGEVDLPEGAAMMMMAEDGGAGGAGGGGMAMEEEEQPAAPIEPGRGARNRSKGAAKKR
jgi:hypothetical protein